VLTDRNGEAQLEFFCSDIYTGFVGIIEGVSGDGKLGSETFEFEVLSTKPFAWEKLMKVILFTITKRVDKEL
jgi:hypothetical protein